jgi:DNA-binding IclR family transcriptional regulator
LTVVAHGEVLPIESIESVNWYWHHFKYPVAIGIPAPMYATGAGKAILAFLDQNEIDIIIKKKGMEKFTETTITDPNLLRLELEKIRNRGYAVSNAEHDELIRSVAAPIYNNDGRVIAAISALGLVSRITPERVPDIAEQVIKAAKEISRLLGYRQ